MKEINKIGMEYKDVLITLQTKYDSIIEYLSTKSELTNSTKIFLIFSYVFHVNNLDTTYAGSYCIENKDTHAVYIGESINIFSRFSQHISDLYKGIHHCEKLQEAFNQSHDISDFILKPLFFLPITCKDKKVEKEETLYLEAAFYLKYKSNKYELYNTLNPYIELKKGQAKYKDEKIDTKNVLKRLCTDEYNILPTKLLKAIRNDLENILDEEDLKNISSINITNKTDNSILKSSKNIIGSPEVPTIHYNITEIVKECSIKGIIPEQYDYNKVRLKLVEAGIIYMDENNLTVATQQSLDQKWFILRSDKINKNGVRKRLYYISEDGRQEIIKVLSQCEKGIFYKN